MRFWSCAKWSRSAGSAGWAATPKRSRCNPLTGSIQSPLFLIFTGSGFDAICGGLLYWLASLTPLKKYMLRDRDDLEIV